MLLNDDFSRRTLVHASQLEWIPSPTAGVERRMLFRIGEEKARATSIVRYAPGSRFPRHVHPGGEEYLVLEGTFQDESGDYPAGAYVRNPPGSSHAPGSDGGCVIFVKLWQFRAEDLVPIAWQPGEGERTSSSGPSGTVLTLFDDGHERVRIEEYTENAPVNLDNPRGLEILVLSGAFRDAEDEFTRWSWLRLPAGMDLKARAGTEGVRIWLKSAPLLHKDVCAF